MAAAKGKQIKVKAKLEVYELCPNKLRQKILGREHKLKFKPIQVSDSIEVVNKDFKDMTPQSFPKDLKLALRLDLAIFHVRAMQELEKIEKAKNAKEKDKAKKNLKKTLEKTAKDLHKKAKDYVKDVKESAGKETKGIDPPKGADKTMKSIEKSHADVQKSAKKVTDDAKTAYDKLASDGQMADREKKKHVEPLKTSIADYGKERKALKDELKKGAKVTKKMNVKNADNAAKKLIKAAKDMENASKAFENMHKGGKKKLEQVPSKLTAGQYKNWAAVVGDLPDHRSQADAKLADIAGSLNTGLKKAAKQK